jgi:hypothetical protein
MNGDRIANDSGQSGSARSDVLARQQLPDGLVVDLAGIEYQPRGGVRLQ